LMFLRHPIQWCRHDQLSVLPLSIQLIWYRFNDLATSSGCQELFLSCRVFLQHSFPESQKV
jgi:hypothetical protein